MEYAGSGSPFIRGGMDSYFRRPRKPHYHVNGINELGNPCIDKVYDLTEEQIKEYHAGYDENEEHGDYKDWG